MSETNNIELLKQELVKQKTEIENKGGTVNVANINPSPSEITTAIQNLVVPDLSQIDLTSDDVLAGKAFVASDGSISTGTNDYNFDYVMKVWFFDDDTMPEQTETTTLYIPSGITRIRSHFFRGNKSKVRIIFNDDLQTIGSYAFQLATNAMFENFSSLQNLQTVEDYAFDYCVSGAIDLSNLPQLKKIGIRGLAGVACATQQIILPSTLESIGTYAFSGATVKLICPGLVIPEGFSLPFSAGMFQMIKFQSDFNPSSNFTAIPTSFNTKGSFTNVTLPSSIASVGNMAFGGLTADPISDYYCTNFWFQRETPPTCGVDCIFSGNASRDDFHIYVPDNSVEAYKAVSNLSKVKSKILPESQMT